MKGSDTTGLFEELRDMSGAPLWVMVVKYRVVSWRLAGIDVQYSLNLDLLYCLRLDCINVEGAIIR